MHAVAAKMKLSPEAALLCLGAPVLLADLATGFPAAAEGAPVGQAIVFARDSAELKAHFSGLVAFLTPEARFWLAFPKASGTIPTDLARERGWELLREAGYETVAQVAIDTDWTALRFKKREAITGFIRAVPQVERQTEGVDYAARTVTLPEDAAKALGDLLPQFERMSFSHKKEWAVALAEAKKPETRLRRIGKLVDAVAGQALPPSKA